MPEFDSLGFVKNFTIDFPPNSVSFGSGSILFSLGSKDKIPKVKKLIFHDPATIVYWEDGSKTVVKCMEGTPFNEYYGFVCALAKKIYGSNSAIDREIQKGERG